MGKIILGLHKPLVWSILAKTDLDRIQLLSSRQAMYGVRVRCKGCVWLCGGGGGGTVHITESSGSIPV